MKKALVETEERGEGKMRLLHGRWMIRVVRNDRERPRKEERRVKGETERFFQSQNETDYSE